MSNDCCNNDSNEHCYNEYRSDRGNTERCKEQSCKNQCEERCNDRHNDRCGECSKKNPVLYAAPSPYPPVCVEGRNPMYARMMLDNVGGSNSEMSAICLYLYNNVITDSNVECSEAFHRISVVEMHHLHIFSALALKLGQNPRLWTQKGNHMSYWTPGYNRYPVELAPLLANAIHGEENAVLKYQKQISLINDCHITEILKRIIEDEELHIKIYRKLQKNIGVS